MLVLHTVVVNDRPLFQLYGSTEGGAERLPPPSWDAEQLAQYDAGCRLWDWSPGAFRHALFATRAGAIAEVKVIPAQQAVAEYGVAAAGNLPLMHELDSAEMNAIVGAARDGRVA